MDALKGTFILRFTVAIILLFHSVGSIFTLDVNAFGEQYLNQVGFAPVGLPLAWAIKLSHLVCAALLIANKQLRWACAITIVVLVAGIIMIHGREGWFVVGGGRNGAEFNVLLIAVLVYLGWMKRDG